MLLDGTGGVHQGGFNVASWFKVSRIWILILIYLLNAMNKEDVNSTLLLFFLIFFK